MDASRQHTPTATDHVCPLCKGAGHITWRTRTRACDTCESTGTVTVDPTAIRAAQLVSRGKATGTFRRSRPSLPENGGVYGAAYVWRMIRFDAGLDMHLPVAASMYVGVWSNTPDTRTLLNILDALAEQIGTELFGRAAMMRGAARWGAALHGGNTPIAVNGPAASATYGQLASVLGVAGIDGLDVGGIDESPEAALTEALGLDGVLDAADVEALLSAAPRSDGS